MCGLVQPSQHSLRVELKTFHLNNFSPLCDWLQYFFLLTKLHHTHFYCHYTEQYSSESSQCMLLTLRRACYTHQAVQPIIPFLFNSYVKGITRILNNLHTQKISSWTLFQFHKSFPPSLTLLLQMPYMCLGIWDKTGHDSRPITLYIQMLRLLVSRSYLSQNMNKSRQWKSVQLFGSRCKAVPKISMGYLYFSNKVPFYHVSIPYNN